MKLRTSTVKGIMGKLFEQSIVIEQHYCMFCSTIRITEFNNITCFFMFNDFWNSPYVCSDTWNFASHRSEEHTSELQSRFDLVCRLLLEKKKKIIHYDRHTANEHQHHE